MKKILLLLFFFTYCFTQAQTLKWVNNLGAPNIFNYNSRLTTDLNNNILVTGQLSGPIDFDPGPAIHSLSNHYQQFIAKYDLNNNYQWVIGITSYGAVICDAITTDHSGNVFIAGNINTTTFFTSTDSLVPKSSAGSDIFLAKYGANGNFLWAFSIGKDGIYNEGLSVNVDNNGNIFLAGNFSDTLSFNPVSLLNPIIAKGTRDVYFAKYDSNGNFLWVHNIGIYKKNSVMQGSSLDNSGNFYMAGGFNDTTNFSTNATPQILIADSIANFVSKYDNNGNYVWAFKLGNANNNAVIHSISADATGNIAIAGEILGTVDFDPSAAVNNVSNPFWYYNTFAAKYNTTGQYLWAFDIVSRPLYNLNQSSYANAVKIDAIGNTYITGALESVADFNPGPGSDSLDAQGVLANFFLAKYDVNGNYNWAFNIGSINAYYANVGYSLATNANNDVIASGVFAGNNNDFDPSASVDTLSSIGYGDIFIAKYSGVPNSIKQFNENKEFQVFPNPSNGIITVSSSDVIDDIKIANILGQTMYENKPNNTNTTLQINNAGVYFVTIISGKDIRTKKIIIQ